MINSENSSNKITVLYIDFDRFKSINDTYGHDVGDEVLIEISKRLAITNNKDNILARLGGDEFVLMISGNYSKDEIENIVIDMINCCNEPIYIGTYEFRVTISVGVTTFPEDGDTRNILIKIAEEIGVIEEISDWVMKEASRQIYEWNTKYGLDLKMGINISPKQLGDINFVNKIKYIIDTYKLEPKWLDIEITENIAMRGEKILEKIFASLNDLSISTSIDDFGTGYSSLSYIQQFSFNRLKIAKELIDKISTDCSNNHIVEAIVVMSKSLKVATIAEGVENYEQVNILKDIGCDEIQGYVFSKPLPAKELEYNFLNL